MNQFRLKRVRLGLTQYDLWRETGIPQSRISLLERGFYELKPDEDERLRSVLKMRPRTPKNDKTSLGATAA